jgi:penicillin-binding protein 2
MYPAAPAGSPFIALWQGVPARRYSAFESPMQRRSKSIQATILGISLALCVAQAGWGGTPSKSVTARAQAAKKAAKAPAKAATKTAPKAAPKAAPAAAVKAAPKAAPKAATPAKTNPRPAPVKAVPAAKRAAPSTASRTAVKPAVIANGPWTEPTFADSTEGDNVDGEDLAIRRAAVEALGPYNGSVVVVDPETGRILTMVNQKLALGSGFQPCSTIKVSVAVAGLSEKVIQPTSKFRLPGLGTMDLTYALAHSNNYYFATLGQKLGFSKVSYYSHLLGYGEKAGWDIPGEQPGGFPAAPPANGGMGMLSSFGEEISQTPLQLAALMSAVANGGTLYYLQYPHTQAELKAFAPRVKRKLPIGELIPVLKTGMRGAVEFGTAQRAKDDGPIAGKTGTCSEGRTHLGWFGSFNDSEGRKLVVVVLLTGGRPAIGPLAAGIAGDVYRILGEKAYFSTKQPFSPAMLLTRQICCSR